MMCSVESENKDINCASSFEIDLFKYQDFYQFGLCLR
jgi:hypothetical protein